MNYWVEVSLVLSGVAVGAGFAMWWNRGRRKGALRRARKDAMSTSSAIIAGMADGIVALDAEGVSIDVNRAFTDMTGFTREELIGCGVPKPYWAPEHIDDILAKFHRARRGELSWIECTFRRKNGERFQALISSSVVDTDDGRLCFATFKDISPVRATEQALRESTQFLESAQQVAQIGSWQWEFGSDRVRWSRQLCRIYGIDREDVELSLAESVRNVHPDDTEAVQRQIKRSLDTGDHQPMEYRVVRPDGEIRTVYAEGDNYCDADGEPVGMIGTVQDVTSRKRTEAQLRMLLERLQQVREQEIASVAREFHDELGQRLTGLKMDVAWVQRRMNGSSGSNEKALVEKLADVSLQIDAAVDSIRGISAQLRPVVLDDFGLVGALEWQAQEFTNRTGLPCRFEALALDNHLDMDRSTAVFRIFQEILTNVARHAQAQSVHARLSENNGEIVLDVSDDGRGIATEEIADGHGLGILGMRERAESCGGNISIGNAVPGGTSVVVRIPIRSEQ